MSLINFEKYFHYDFMTFKCTQQHHLALIDRTNRDKHNSSMAERKYMEKIHLTVQVPTGYVLHLLSQWCQEKTIYYIDGRKILSLSGVFGRPLWIKFVVYHRLDTNQTDIKDMTAKTQWEKKNKDQYL